MNASFDDIRLAEGAIRAHSRQGGPVCGAAASVLLEAPGRRFLRGLSRNNDPQLYLVIEAPTWSLRRRVGQGQERGAADFADTVNAASRRASASTWRPASGLLAS